MGKDISIFETGAILYYLAQKTGKFLPDAATDPAAHFATMEWLMWQMGGIGPMMGQANHFRRYAPERIAYATERYANETKRLFGVADTRLGQNPISGRRRLHDCRYRRLSVDAELEGPGGPAR